MCFSAPASFIASAALLGVGATSLRMARPQHRLVAAIPVAFAVQQFTEGMQWMFLNQGSSSQFFGYAFLFFAFMWWPTYIPIAVYAMEKKDRPWLRWVIALGIAVSLSLFVARMTSPLTVTVVGHSISYGVTSWMSGPIFTKFITLVEGCYMLAVMVPLLFSKVRFLQILGVTAGLAAYLSSVFYAATYISTWCFFGAVVSSVVIWGLWRDKR
ncbi:hypothetical protein BH11PAT4_BH11PAT4_3400 [soil metagenome]